MKIFKSKWGAWMDVSSGSVDQDKFILQARRKKNGKIKMRVERVNKAWGCSAPTLEQLSEIKP